MKRAFLAAVFGGLITVVSGTFAAQAAPLTAATSGPTAEKSVQTVGYGYKYRRHYYPRRHVYHYHRPLVRWHRYHYVRPHYGWRHHHHRWSHRYHRRHYH